MQMLLNPFRVPYTTGVIIPPGNSTSLRSFHYPGLLLFNPFGVVTHHLFHYPGLLFNPFGVEIFTFKN